MDKSRAELTHCFAKRDDPIMIARKVFKIICEIPSKIRKLVTFPKKYLKSNRMRHQHCDYNNLCPAVLLDNDATHIFDFDLKIRSNLDENASGNLIFTQWHGTPSRKFYTKTGFNLMLLDGALQLEIILRAKNEGCERLYSQNSI